MGEKEWGKIDLLKYGQMLGRYLSRPPDEPLVELVDPFVGEPECHVRVKVVGRKPLDLILRPAPKEGSDGR